MDENMSLFQRLKNYCASDTAPLHMPGHKRNVQGLEFLERLGGAFDISEIEGFDDLHRPEGILKDAMEKTAKLWKSDRSFFLVNGSTCGLLAAVRSASEPGGKIIMARNCHKSVYNAAELCRLEPIYLEPARMEDFSFCGSISPNSVELAVRDNPGTPVILTSPNYEGIISNIAEVAIICHIYGSPLIVDEAHGAHLDLSSHFTGGALQGGADIIVQSLHKTMTGLSQTGLLHLCGSLISEEKLQNELSVFQTSSPSYLLMASIDETRELVLKRGGELFRRWKEDLDRFDESIGILQNLKVPGHSVKFQCQPEDKKAGREGYKAKKLSNPSVFGYDRSKIIISCEGTDTTGVELMNSLRQRYSIECEMASCGYVLAMTGLLENQNSLERLSAALIELDGELRKTAPRLPFSPPKTPPRRISAFEASLSEQKSLYLKDAAGRISAEYIWAYPPGIPMAVPGEELTPELLRSFIIQREAGVSLRSSSGGMPKMLRVVD